MQTIDIRDRRFEFFDDLIRFRNHIPEREVELLTTPEQLAHIREIIVTQRRGVEIPIGKDIRWSGTVLKAEVV